jgi:mevalonate kinase
MIEAQKYYSNGKLLLTGEYLVLSGARSLAIPVAFGQSLQLESTGDQTFSWKTKVKGADFLSLYSESGSLNDAISSMPGQTDYLLNVLKAASDMAPDFSYTGKRPVADINFNLNWGLGSSSTLISNIAYWTNVDPFELHFRVSSGSGYDIACARASKPLIYSIIDRQPEYVEMDFKPAFSDHLYFLYLGSKQDSNLEVKSFQKREKILEIDVSTMNELTDEFVSARNVSDLNRIIVEHEKLVGGLIGKTPLKKDRFPLFEGEIKSLGAWGGDFAMITFEHGKEALKKEIERVGLKTLISYDEMSLY